MRPAKKQGNVPVPKELASIIRSASPLTKKEDSIMAHLEAIKKLKQQETTSFLRAASMRIQNS